MRVFGVIATQKTVRGLIADVRYGANCGLNWTSRDVAEVPM
jgi:hypothetical protein